MRRKTPILNNIYISFISVSFSLGILGVLVAISLKSYQRIPAQVSVARIFSNIDPIISELYTFYALNNRWPTKKNDLPLLQDDEYNKDGGDQYILDKGSLHVVMNSGSRELDGKVISFRKAVFPNQIGGSTLWLCGYQPIPDGMRVDVENRTNVDKKYMLTRCK